MTNLAPLTDTEIQDFLKEWYHKLDIHVPMVELLPLLADAELEMVFPEATVQGHAGFEGWYQRVIRVFFDEMHTLKEATPTFINEAAEVKVVVQWEASIWNPPNPKSDRIKCDAYQRLTIKRSPLTGQPILTNYIVDSLEYAEGSARL